MARNIALVLAGFHWTLAVAPTAGALQTPVIASGSARQQDD